MGPDDWTETARRVRAAMGYGNIKRAEAAQVMGTTPGTLDRILGSKGSETKTASWDQLKRLADHVGLTPEWFSADLDRLPEIVPPGSPIFVRPLGPLEAAARLVQQATAVAQETRQTPEEAAEAEAEPGHQRRASGGDDA